MGGIDGTNATIIGEGDGNFLADRNGIARVWMDHALWPLMTTKLYIDQTGDVDILNQKVSYFKDSQIMRGTAIDALWKPECGNEQRTDSGDVYTIDAFRRWSYGAVGGMKAVIAGRYTVSLQYYESIKKVQKQCNLRNYGYQLNVGYQF